MGTAQRKANRKTYHMSFGEEVANAISHGVMAIAALCFIPVAAVVAYARGTVFDAVAISVFSISLFLMFLGSCLYHAMEPESKHKGVFHILDHIFIYVAIAGSYTPIALSVLKGWQGWVVFGVQWTMVLFGILHNSLLNRKVPKTGLAIYLIMGWTVVLFFPLFLAKARLGLQLLLLAGGISYTVGAIFYAMKRFCYHHMVWHLFVNIGAACHAVGIVFFF
jgi:hemolysin III